MADEQGRGQYRNCGTVRRHVSRAMQDTLRVKGFACGQGSVVSDIARQSTLRRRGTHIRGAALSPPPQAGKEIVRAQACCLQGWW